MGQTTQSMRPSVLVVEDEALQRLEAEAIVEAAGFNAIGVSNADDAIRVLENRDDVQALFTDVQMPGSMDGVALTHLVKKRWPAVGTLVVSGKTDLTAAELPTGARFFAKPYRSIQIQSALRQVIAQFAGLKFLYENIKRLRTYAEEARTIGEVMTQQVTRASMFQIAKSYEDMADSLVGTLKVIAYPETECARCLK